MRRPLFTSRARWTAVATALTFGVSLAAGVGRAQAIVVDMTAAGPGAPVSVPYNAADQNYGVSLVPNQPGGGGIFPGVTSGQLGAANVPYVTSSAPCLDPALASDLILGNGGLCSHGGPVLHNNETFAVTWDPARRYWASTRNYVEQFLSDVATGSGGFTSPFSLTPQYTDGTGRAANQSVYGGGCIDYGAVGKATCQFGNVSATASGNDYPASGCPNGGSNVWTGGPNGPIQTAPNDICLTDAQIRNEVATMVAQTGLLGRTKPGTTPLVDLMTPPGVVTCLDAGGNLCSANGASNAQFCSYHSQVNVGGTLVSYVVLPWVAHWTRGTICDDSDAPQIPNPVPVDQLAIDVGARLVSPLSQGQLATITNPGLSAWFGLNGAEINDNGCTPLPGSNGLDLEAVGPRTYPLQRQYNNAGAIETDPNALPCSPNNNFSPTFVVPSAVNPGDQIQFDGSTTVSSLMVSKDNFVWSFGDGTTALGPSVVHSYGAGGNYTVKLTVTDRGGNTAAVSQTVAVLGANGQPVPVNVTPPTTPPSSQKNRGLSVRLQLVPQSLRSVLNGGLSIRVSSNAAADGIASVFIPRSAAKRARIAGNGSSVRIGLGTVTIKNGTGTLHVHLAKATAAKLRSLGHVTLTIRLALVASGNQHRAFVAAGRY
jgi:hypothetical protein